jgi:hypothetical protein
MRLHPVLLLFLFSISTLAAQPAERRLSIAGSVVDAATRQPLVGATVRVGELRIGAITGSNGRFEIFDLAPGEYQLRISMIGYRTIIVTDLVVSGVRPAEVEAELEEVVTSDAVVIRPDFFARGPSAIPNAQTLSNEEIRRLPGGFEDVVRAISTLPGVAQVSNGRNDLLVRGGAPSENLFLIDNIETPNINHFGTQGTGGGPLSFVNLDFVSDVSFSAGGFGAQYGDRLSSLLSIDLRSGRKDRFGGKATISATQFGLNLEGPVTDRATYLFSARRSYLDLIFLAAGFSFVPEYWDFLGKASWNLGDGDRIDALAIAAIDRVKQFNRDADERFDNSRVLDNTQNQLVAGITHRHLFESGYINTTLARTLVDYSFRQSDSLLKPIFLNNSTEDEFSLRSDAVVQLDELTEVSTGAAARVLDFDTDLLLSIPSLAVDTALEERFTKGSAYLQLRRYLFEGVPVTLGGRLDYFSGVEKSLNPSVRFSTEIPLDELSRVTLALGRYYQAPSAIWLAANRINRELKSLRSDMIVAGIDRRLADDLRLGLEGYYKRYADYPASRLRPWLVLANTGAGFGGTEDGFASFGLEPLESIGTGRSFGAELLLQKKLSDVPFYGTAALSINSSWFTAADGVERPSSFDQRLIFNVSGGYRIDESWELGMKFRLATGRPYTTVDSTGDPSFGYQVVSGYNGQRLAPSHALDLRIDRRWALEKWSIIAYIDLQNIYNRKNPNPPRWNPRTRSAESGAAQLGILPSIGLSAEF